MHDGDTFMFAITDNLESPIMLTTADNSETSTTKDVQLTDESTVILEESKRSINSLIHRLAIRLTLVLTIPKTEVSFKYLKQVCDKMGVGNLYFYTVQGNKNNPTHKQVKSLLAEYGISYFKYIQTNGCDAEVMNLEKITHIIDDRPGWLAGMLTFEGYIRSCYCVTPNPNLKYLKAENIKVSTLWMDMIRLLVKEIQQPLPKYDHTVCWKCNNFQCKGECAEDNFNLLMNETNVVARKTRIVSWNVRSLRHCYRSGSFAEFIKNTEAHFIFLQ